MEIELSLELQAKLDRIASQHGRDSNSLVHEAVERLVGYDEWFICQVETGLAQVDRGEGLDDLQSIANYLFEKTPANAARLIREICAVPPWLTRFSKL
jgi:predicted transcriptional regulator